ncbi:hypothetical protein [Altererythrobacter sp. MTPC7]|uniref:hypothetical protein n=1 Tax=Altererythrobacter sp. MTPC7 TaxID=3056567 RepID=UPI0036F3C489
MKRTIPASPPTVIALSGALALAACGGGNDAEETVPDDSVEIVADEAMDDIEADPVVDEEVVPLPPRSETVRDAEPEGPSEDEVAQLESAGEAAAAAAADVAAIAAGAAGAAEATQDAAEEDLADEQDASAAEVTE